MSVCTRSLFVFLVLVACRPASPQQAATEQPVASQDTPPPRPASQPAKAVDAGVPKPNTSATKTTPAPWTLEMAGFRPPAIPDRLWFHGWDDTGRIFAWERRQASAGADCDTRHVLYAVNAKDDAFVQDGLLVIKHDSPEADDSGQCRPKDLNVAERRAAFLRRHGIRSKRLIPPTRPTATKAGFWVTHGAAQLRFSFAVQHRSTDPYDDAVDKGAAYRLVLDGAEPVVIEDGRRRRPNVMDYRLDEARWFSSPTGDYGALIVQRVERGFEGAHLTWMSNGVRVRGRP